MLQEARDLQNSAVSKLVNVLAQNKKEFTFKAPTGSGKTYMMADFMNRIISANKNVIFIVSTLSKSNLAEQNYESFKNLSENGTFPKLNPFLINSDSSGEGSLFIPTNYNVYVLPRDLYKEKSKLKNEGTFLNFLQVMKGTLFSAVVEALETTNNGDFDKHNHHVFNNQYQNKTLYLIKDECHIATTNLDELNNYFSAIINFSATPKLSWGQTPDVEITNLEAENANLIKKIELGAEDDSLENALEKFEEIKSDYINLLGVNPCLIIQISNKDKAEEELQNNILPSLSNHQELKWVYIAGEEKNCKTNDSGLNKLSVKKWKDYMKGKVSTISVIIFKMVISEGWDIPRACMIYQIRDSKSKQLDEQVMGRVRRNPRLLDFETLGDEAKNLAMTAWIWGIVPDTTGGTKSVKLFKNYNIENEIRVKPTKLQNVVTTKSFNIESYIKNLTDDKIVHPSIFEMYHALLKYDNSIQNMCWNYATDYSKWRLFSENLSGLKSSYDAYMCDYEKSMQVCTEVSFPKNSCFVESEKTLPLDDWVWCRRDNANDFSFDSEAERQWAHILEKIQNESIAKTSNLEFADDSNKFLWGKNFPFNSEIKFEYYLNGIHSSYPDFVMKDKAGRIHIFEVKSINDSNKININKEEYEEKIRALKECYKECSKKTGHIFYLPLMQGSDWKIIKYENGEEDNFSKKEFFDFVKEPSKNSVSYKTKSDFGTMKVAE